MLKRLRILFALAITLLPTPAFALAGGTHWTSQARRSWIPSDLSGLALYLDANAGVTQSGGTASAWADQTSNANSASQATGANQPTVSSNVFGTGGTALTFDGSTKKMNVTSASSLNTGTGGYAVCAVYKSPASWWSGQLFRAIFDKSAGTAWPSTSDALGIGLAVGSTGTIAAVHAGLNTTITSTAALANSTKYVFCYAYSGSSSHTLRINGAIDTTSATATNSNNNSNTLGIGWNPTVAGRFLQGDVGAVLFYTSAHTAAELHTLESYLGVHSGISIP